MAKTKSNKPEKDKDWKKLCAYIEKNVLGYDENQTMSRNLCLRLRGFSQGKYMANNDIESQAKYPYEVILAAFIYSNSDIQRALKNVHFENEKHKLNYVLRIVEENLNDVYARMKKAKKNDEEVKAMKMEVAENSNLSSIYNKRKTSGKEDIKNANNRLKDLW